MKTVMLTFLATSALTTSLFAFILDKHNRTHFPQGMNTTPISSCSQEQQKEKTIVKEKIVYRDRIVKPRYETVNVWPSAWEEAEATCRFGVEKIIVELKTGRKLNICKKR